MYCLMMSMVCVSSNRDPILLTQPNINVPSDRSSSSSGVTDPLCIADVKNTPQVRACLLRMVCVEGERGEHHWCSPCSPYLSYSVIDAASMTEYDRGTRAHKTTPSMLQQWELNIGHSAKERIVVQSHTSCLSNCANGSEILMSFEGMKEDSRSRLTEPALSPLINLGGQQVTRNSTVPTWHIFVEMLSGRERETAVSMIYTHWGWARCTKQGGEYIPLSVTRRDG